MTRAPVQMAAYSCEDHSSQCLLCPCPSCSPAHLPPPPPSYHRSHPNIVTKGDDDDDTPHDRRHSFDDDGDDPDTAKAGHNRAGSKKRPVSPCQPVEDTHSERGGAGKETPADDIRLTRRTRQRLSLPLPLQLADPPSGVRPRSWTSPRKPGRKGAAPKRRQKRRPSGSGPTRKENRGSGEQLLLSDATASESGCDAGSHSDCHHHHHQHQHHLHQHHTPAQSYLDRNINARQARKAVPGKDRNLNVRKRPARKRRVVAKLNPVHRAARSKLSGGHVVNFTALKPISATCSCSGLGLVVTYRPVFTESGSNRRRTRKRTGVTSAVKNDNTNTNTTTTTTIQRPVARRDSATSPRTPSPWPQGKEGSSTPTFLDHIKAVINSHGSSQKETGVKEWLRGIPQSSSPRVRKHRPASLGKTRDRSLDREEDVYKTFPNANHSARKTPIPGPSWNPEEFRHPVSRSRSPYYMPSRPSSSSSRRPRPQRRASPRSVRTKKPAALARSAMAEVYDGGRSGSEGPRYPPGRRPLSPLTPPPLSARPNVSEGWNVTRSLSPHRKRNSPRGRRKKNKAGRERERDTTTHHVAAASDSRSSHPDEELGSRSRSSSRGTSSTAVSARAGPRDKDQEDPRRATRRPHRRHHRHRHDRTDNGETAKDAAACVVM